MEHSESIAKLAEALAKAQAVMEGASKDSSNPFFKSTYASLAAVWDACRKPLSDNGLSIIQTSCSDTPDNVIIETMLAHSSGEWIKGRLPMKPVKSDPQGIGSCITYARRYSLAAIVGISPEDDDGNIASGQGDIKKTAAKTETKKQESAKTESAPLDPKSVLHKKIEAMISEAGIDRVLFKEWLNSAGWLPIIEGKLSMNSLTETTAQLLIDKWPSALKTFNGYVDKKNEGSQTQ